MGFGVIYKNRRPNATTVSINIFRHKTVIGTNVFNSSTIHRLMNRIKSEPGKEKLSSCFSEVTTVKQYRTLNDRLTNEE
ncbi:hypothetical protein NECAME_15291 [Necator americanus]|uniref:Uncharacterized protein n=1 Tax=Necator americanus TaxID=51031 RepID=W2SL38_NECAM|nr:hypothetical protein NECAME_15291 [Necator americanus]ETN69457.1 hypothetical protein NECAME_15291 [Necator americanus]